MAEIAESADRSPDTHITEDMVEAGARTLWAEAYGPARRTWDAIGEVDRDVFRQYAKRALSAALADYTVAPTPAPHQVREDATIWLAEARRIAASVDFTGHPFVLLDSQLWLVTEAEAVGIALVAAAREARRLAAGSVSLKGEDTNE